MLLKEYLKKENIRCNAFAEQMGISATFLYNVLKGRRGVSPDLAKKIEAKTGGEVTRMEILYPDEFTEEKIASDCEKKTAKEPKRRVWIVTEEIYI